MNFRPAVLAASIAVAALLAAVSAPALASAASGSSPDRRNASAAATDGATSSAAIAKLETIESAIASAGECSLPATKISALIAQLSAKLPSVAALAGHVGAAVLPSKTCADISAAATLDPRGSALTSMWAWGNAVDPSVDARGQGLASFSPATIAAYASAHKLKNVRLSTPWASDQGDAVRGWLSSSVSALHATGATVTALGGDNAWVADPTLLTQWMTAAHTAARFDGVQLDVEPWTADSSWTTNQASIAAYIAMVRTASARAHALGLTLGVDAPWWLSTTPYLGTTVLSAILPYVDSVSIVAFANHAGGADGVIAQAWPAVEEASATLTPFTIGVQTSSDAIAGGAQYTFADQSSAALETEAAKVRTAYTPAPGYSGVTVEEYASWAALK